MKNASQVPWERRRVQLVKYNRSQESLERLLESVIIMLGKTNERAIDLNKRVTTLEKYLPRDIKSSFQRTSEHSTIDWPADLLIRNSIYIIKMLGHNICAKFKANSYIWWNSCGSIHDYHRYDRYFLPNVKKFRLRQTFLLIKIKFKLINQQLCGIGNTIFHIMQRSPN